MTKRDTFEPPSKVAARCAERAVACLSRRAYLYKTQMQPSSSVVIGDRAARVWGSPAPVLQWHALRVRSNCEALVSTALRSKGYEEYLPTYYKTSARIKNLEVPLFSGYVFCRLDINQRLPVLTTPGVVNLVSFGTEFLPIPESQIESVRAIVDSGLPSLPWPNVQEGDRVRINKGTLSGVEGVLIEVKSELRIVVSVPMLNRAVAVEIDRGCIERVTGTTTN